MRRPAALSLHRPLPGARLRIAGFPQAGGGASAFHGLGRVLAPRGIELCPLQAPGRENRLSEPFLPSVEAMAAEFADAILSLPQLPTVFLGHSLGGLVAYLAARLCIADGNGPRAIVASASLSPLLRHDPSRGGEPPRPLRERIVALGGVPNAIGRDPELFAIFEPVIRADLDLAERYRHRGAEPLPCPIAVYSGTADAGVPPEAASAWQGLTRDPLRCRTFEGGHFFLFDAPDRVAAALLEDAA